MKRESRHSRQTRQSMASIPGSSLEHDAIAVELQQALGARVILVRAIGEGGMGRVYLGRDPQLKRFVAVKVLLQSQGADAEAHARFQREAQAIAAVSHPNVVAIYGVGELPNGTPYFIMQHVSGGSMADRLLKSGPLPIDEAESILGDVAAALAAAHKRGIVHRDVKPANVLWDTESERATVSDFGIASLQSTEEDDEDVRITQAGMTVGSPAYMSPEQLLTEPITPKSDIYALGLLGYELLTAQGPYAAATPTELIAAHLRDAPRRLSERRPDVPPNLEEVLLRCLAKSAAERPTAEEVMLALTPGAADMLEWPPPGLERARGGLWRLVEMPAFGVACLLLPLLLLLSAESFYVFGESFAVPLLVAASTVLGIVTLLRASVSASRMGAALVRGARLGYGWGTIAEVTADRRGDTGSLIAGTREYFTLSVDQRAALRVLRVVEALIFSLAGPAVLAAAVASLAFLGGRPGGARGFAGAVIWTFAVFVGAGLLAGLYEHILLRGIRRKRAHIPRSANEHELAPAWYAFFERSREGQGFGPGQTASGVLTAIGVGALCVVMVACVMLIGVVSFTVASAQIVNSLGVLDLGSWLTYTGARSDGGASYRIPPSGSISPLQAGDALLAVSSAWNRRRPSPLERPVTTNYSKWHRVAPPPEMFPKHEHEMWTTAAVRAAASGLSAEQSTFLTGAAAHPARDEFARAAYAEQADVSGALLVLPLRKPLAATDFPFEALTGVRWAAESYAAMVALGIAAGRPEEAERRAREIIAVGALLQDQAVLAHNSAGNEILKRGVEALEAVYVAAGRERDARVLLDSVVIATQRVRRAPMRQGSGDLRRALRNTSLTRGARMEVLTPLALATCANPRQLLFGVDETYPASIAYARDSVARFPSEQAFVTAIGNALSQGPPEEARGGLFLAMADVVDGLVGGRRFASCASSLTLLSGR